MVVYYAMATTKPNCRDRLTLDDFHILASTLAKERTGEERLVDLFRDEPARDAALESDRLLRLLLDTPNPLPVSPQLYFYVLTRHSLVGFDREIADYIAGVLAMFLDVRRLRELPEHPEIETEYVTDMLATVATSSAERAYWLRAHVGNYTLFVSGIFPGRIQYQAARRGAPGLSFYEEVGSANFRLASDHHLARRNGLADVYRTIAEHFSAVRCDLNRLSDRLLCIEPCPNPIQ